MDFNKKVLGETSSKYIIKKFYKAKAITTLKLFSFKYHPGEKYIRAYLFEHSRKFLFIIKIYLYEYKGKVFYIKKRQVIKIFIKS